MIRLAMRFGLEGALTRTCVRLGRFVTYRADRVKAGVGGHVGGRPAVRPARHRQRRLQGAGPRLRHALADEGLHRDEQLHDRHHRRRQRDAVYFGRGDIHPLIAAPVALGVLLGASVGTVLMGRLRNTTLRMLFLPVILYLAVSMIARGLGLGGS